MQNRIPRVMAMALAMMSGLAAVAVAVADDKPAAKDSKVTYDDHVRPILREHCFSCHNQNDAKSGLALDSYASVIEGGSSGEIVFEDDLDSSRLWTLISHQEDPVMPPGQDKLPDAKLAFISKWIEMGMPENAGASAKTKKKTVNLAIEVTIGKPEGPAAMPEGLSREPLVYTQRSAAVSAIAASPWAPLVAVAGQQQVLLYHTDTGALLGVLPFPEGIAHALRFSRDGSKLLVGGGRGGAAGCAVLFDVRSGERLVKVGEELDAVLAADVNADLTRIALGGPGRIVRVFSTETGELLHEIRKHTDWIFAVRFSPDGVLLATADRSNGLFVWEADTAREYLDLRGHGAAVTDVAWRGDSNLLASASLDGTVRLWEMNDGKQTGRANAHGGGVNAVWFAHDGRVATAGQDRTAKLWDAGLKPLKTFPAFKEPALEVALTHNGERVVAGDWAGQIAMWQAADAKQVATLAANPPTLAMQIADREKLLADALAAAATSTRELAAVETRVSEADARRVSAVQAAKQGVDTLTKQVAQAKSDVVTQSSQMSKLTQQVAAAKTTLQAAQNALELATSQLRDVEGTLAKAQQREQASRKRVPETEKKLQAAQTQLAKVTTDTKLQVEAVAKELAAKKAAQQKAQAGVNQLKAAIDQLQAEQAAGRKNEKPAPTPDDS